MFKKAKSNIKKFWAWRMRVTRAKKDLVIGSMAGRLLFIGAALGIMAVVAPPAVVVVPVAFASALAGALVGWKAVKIWKNHKIKSVTKKSAAVAAPQNAPASDLGKAAVEQKFNAVANTNEPAQATPEVKATIVPPAPKAA